MCQSDGNLVLLEVNRAERKVIWSTETVAAIPTKFTLKVTRPGALTGKISDFDIYVNGTVVGKIGNKEEKTFEVNGYLGRNSVMAFGRNFKNQFFPDSVTKDTEDKLAGFKFFAVNQPDETISLTIGWNDDDERKNPYSVTQEVPHDWQAPDIAGVKFDKDLIEELVEAEPPVLIPVKTTYKYTERVTQTQRVVLSESFRAGTKVGGKVISLTPTGIAMLEGGIRTEYKRDTVQLDATEKVSEKVIEITGAGQLIRETKYAYYRTGSTTVYIDGYKHEVPFKIFVRTVTRPVEVKQ